MYIEVRDADKVLQCTGQLPQQRIICAQMSTGQDWEAFSTHSLQFHRHSHLFFHQYHIVLFTVVLESVLKSTGINPPTFFCFKINHFFIFYIYILKNYSFLYFHVSFRYSSSIFIKVMRICVGLFLGFLYCSIYPCVYPLWITTQLWLVHQHKPGNWIDSSHFIFLLKIVYFIPMSFYISLRINLSASTKILLEFW